MFKITEQEVKKQLAEKEVVECKMKGIARAMKKNDGLLILDGGTITGM